MESIGKKGSILLKKQNTDNTLNIINTMHIILFVSVLLSRKN